MFDHIGIFVSDTARSFPFFEKALAPLGIVVRERQRKWGSIVMSSQEWPPFLWIGAAGGKFSVFREGAGTVGNCCERASEEVGLDCDEFAGVAAVSVDWASRRKVSWDRCED